MYVLKPIEHRIEMEHFVLLILKKLRNLSLFCFYLDTCVISKDFRGIISACRDFYELHDEEKSDYDVGWKPIKSSTRSKRSVQGKNSRAYIQKERNQTVQSSHLLNPNVSTTSESLLPTNSNNSSSQLLSNKQSYSDKDNEESMNKLLKFHKDTISLEKSFPHEEIFLHRNKRALKIRVKQRGKGGFDIGIEDDEKDFEIEAKYILSNGRIKTNPSHWIYRSSSNLRGFPYWGKFGLYSGGGYVADLGNDLGYAEAAAAALAQDNWIDMNTRAVFFEFSVYNANENLFGTAFVLIEILPSGQIVPSGGVKVFRLYPYAGSLSNLTIASEILLVILLFYFIYRDLRRMYQKGSRFWKELWSWIDITLTISVFAALILWFIRWYEGDKNLIELHKNSQTYISFQYAATADEALAYCIGVIVFLSILKFMKLLQILPMIVVLNGALKRTWGPVFNYCCPFFVAFLAFALFATQVFNTVDSFASFKWTFETQFMMLLGGSTFKILETANRVLGPMYFMIFEFFEFFYLFNVFLAIVNEGIANSAMEDSPIEDDLAFINFIVDKFHGFLSPVATIFGSQYDKKSKDSSTQQSSISVDSTTTATKTNIISQNSDPDSRPSSKTVWESTDSQNKRKNNSSTENISNDSFDVKIDRIKMSVEQLDTLLENIIGNLNEEDYNLYSFLQTVRTKRK